MTWVGSILPVLQFEWRRALTWRRLLLWGALMMFPSVIILCMRTTFASPDAPWSLSAEPGFDARVWIFVLFFLVPEFTTCLGILLCITPAIQVELENRSWIYLAVRPRGRRLVLVGKYVWAVLATCVVSWLALIPAVWLASPPTRLHTFAVLAVLSVFSAAGRGAAYALLAVVVPQRAMVFAVLYTLIMEYIVGWLPAIINQITVQFHVRCLLMRWMGLDEWMGTLRLFFDDASWLQHVLALCLYTLVVLGAAVVWLEQRSFVSSEEG